MYRKLIFAGAMTAAFTAPAFAEWNVLKPTPGPASPTDLCMIVERTAAATGETKIAGPFATEAEAKTAAEAAPACKGDDSGGSAGAESGGSSGGGAPN